MNCLDMELTLQIVRFVDDNQPGWVECVFVDAEERKHTFVDKVPIFSTECLDAASKYPRSGGSRVKSWNGGTTLTEEN